MATTAKASNSDRGSTGLNGMQINATSSPSQMASTSAVTLEQTPAHSIKEEDEDAKLFASLVNGIQSGVVTSSEVPDSASNSNQETSDATAAWANAISNLQNVTGGSLQSLDLMQPLSNGLTGLEDPSTFVQSSSIPNDAEVDMPPEPIAAYAKLEFPGFSYYIQTLDFTIGRRPAEFRSQTSLQQHITGSSKLLGDVDVDLGPLKSISRFHVRIFYQDQPAPPQWISGHDPNFSSNTADQNGSVRSQSSFDEDAMASFAPQGRFVLQVLGRNGCCVDDVYVGKGAIVPLGKRTKIQIAERVFYFVLPPSHSLLMSMDDDEEEEEDEDEEDESIGSSAEEESEEDEVPEESSSSGSLGSSSDEESESETLLSSSNKKKLPPKKNAKATPAGGGKAGKGKGMGDDIEDVMDQDSEKGTKQSNSNRKRKRGARSEEEEKVLKVGTPIGVEALTFNKKKKRNNDTAEIGVKPSVSPEEEVSLAPSLAGKGKGGGKSAIVSAAMARARADVEAIQAAAEAQAGTISQTPANIAGVAGDTSKLHPATPSSSSQQGPASTSATPASPVLDKNKKPLPPAGPGIKPDKSNMDLIREAMNGPLSLSRGGKMALQEIYEYLTTTYEWFRNNSRANGRDWHSAIRHAVGNARDMDRIQRKPHESGKGVFYAFSSSDAAKAARAEAEAAAAQSDTTNAATPTPPPNSLSTPSGRPPPTENKGNVSGASKPTKSDSSSSGAGAISQKSINDTKTVGNSTNASATSDAVTQSSSASPAPPSAIAPDGRVRIVVGKAPAEALAQMAGAPKPAITQSIENLFGGPPIVHHEGTLFLSPIVFGAMSTQEINDIGGKGAQQALATLQAQLVAHLQSKMAGGAASPPPPSSPSPNPRPPSASASPGPGQVRPPLGNRPPQQVNAAQTNNPRPALARPAGGLNGRPPIQSRPPITRPTGTAGSSAASTARPGTTQPSSASRPSGPLPVRPTGRPPLTNIARPTGAAATRPGRPPLQPRPAVQGPSASIARPPTNSTGGPGTTMGQSRPPQGAPVPGAPNARPSGPPTAKATNTTAARSALPRPGSSIVGSSVSSGSTVRPVASRPPLHNAQRPIGTAITASSTGQSASAPVRPSLARPVTGRPPLSARPRPALPGQQVGRPPITATAAATQAGSARPSIPTTAAIGNGKAATSTSIRPIENVSAAARPVSSSSSGVAMGGSTNANSSSVTSTTGAPSAGSSQSDMAALLALLTGGKLDSSKLTPAQHELLQRAGRLAAEQQKAQQQKVAAAVTAGDARSPSPVKQQQPSQSTTIKAGQAVGSSALPARPPIPQAAGSTTQGLPAKSPLASSKEGNVPSSEALAAKIPTSESGSTSAEDKSAPQTKEGKE